MNGRATTMARRGRPDASARVAELEAENAALRRALTRAGLDLVRQFGKRHIREAPPQTTYPTTEQVERLVAHAAPMAGRIIRLLAQTGMRLDEVRSMERPQVSIPRREVRLTKTKTLSPRVVPLSDAALGTLLGTPRHIISPFVFWHADGARYTSFSGAFRKIAARAGVPSRCHDPRHHFASEFAQQTGDIAAFQSILGHKTIAITMRYSHLMTEHLHRAMGRYGAGIVGTNTGTSPADSDGQPSAGFGRGRGGPAPPTTIP